MIFELISAATIVIIGFLFLSLSSLSMPSTVAAMLLVIFFISFLAFAALVWKEKASDERESLHSLIAGKVSYITGIGVLVVGIIYQTTMHSIDPWLIATLCIMVVTKIVLLVYSRYKM